MVWEGGAEVARVPQPGRQSLKNAAKYTFSKLDLIKGLELDARYAKSMGDGAGVSGGKGSSTPQK